MQNELGKKDGENTINFCIGKKYTTEVMVCEESVSFDKLAFSICSFLNLLLCCILKRKKRRMHFTVSNINVAHFYSHLCKHLDNWCLSDLLPFSIGMQISFWDLL